MAISNQDIFSFLDLTSLNAQDTAVTIEQFTKSALAYSNKGYTAAAVCVFPNYAGLVSGLLEGSKIRTAVVGACFPASQSFEKVKLMECEMAIMSGADEVDVVINLAALYQKEEQKVMAEIGALKEVVTPNGLKVIIESGLLEERTLIRKATQLAILGGADFVKTSTGKVPVGATPEAVEEICHVIKEHFDYTGDRIGIKISGGIRSKSEGVMYYSLVHNLLGSEQMHPDFFRIGASSLALDLING